MMNKLTNVENNTSTHARDLISLSEKVESQSAQFLLVESDITANEKRKVELQKKQNSIVSEIDKTVGGKFKSLETQIKQGNENFHAKLLAEAKGQLQDVTRDLKDEILQEHCDARKPKK